MSGCATCMLVGPDPHDDEIVPRALPDVFEFPIPMRGNELHVQTKEGGRSGPSVPDPHEG